MYIYNNNKKLILMHNNIKLSSPKDTTSTEVPTDPIEPPTVVNFTVSNPYEGASTNVIKMTPHIHTTDSDGRQSNSEVVTAYKNAGYGAIAITNHNSPSKGYTALSPQQNISGITHIRGTEESQDAKHIGVIGCTSVAGNTTDKPIFEILGIKLFLDDLIIIGVMYFLYQQHVHDEMLYLILFMLLFS